MENQMTPEVVAEKLFMTMCEFTHVEQVDIFQLLRSKLLKSRDEQQECIIKAIANSNQDLELHKIGSEKIASAL